MIHFDAERDPIDTLAEEFAARYRRGEQPSVGEYVARYPEWAEQLRALLPPVAKLEQLKRLRQAARTFDVDVNALERLGDYRIVREVGRGGMGIVYEAIQESLKRRVALKILPRHALLDPRKLERFQREARAAAQLHHTNVVPVFGVGEHDGLHFYVMQFIDGQGLNEILAKWRSGPRRLDPPYRTTFGSEAVGLEDSTHPTGLAEWKSGKPSRDTSRGGGKTSPATQSAVVPVGTDDSLFVVPPSGAVGAVPVGTDDSLFVVPPSGTVGAVPVGTDDSLFVVPPSGAVGAVPVGTDDFVNTAVLPLAAAHAAAVLRDGGRWRWIAQVGIQAAEALQYAHKHGILHRDVKPANLLLDRSGNLWITDFGLAKAAEQHDLTRTGDVVGTLHYMAPECFQGQADARSDVYSLGLTLYELLTLETPFNESNPMKLIRQVTEHEPTRPRKLNPAIPRDLETIVQKAIAHEPGRRYQTAEALADDLRRFLDDQPIHARRATTFERGWRWCRRHRAVAALAATALLSLVTAAVAGWAGYVSTTKALEREARKSAEAEAATRRAEANVELLLQQFEEIFNNIAQRERMPVPYRRPGEAFAGPMPPPADSEENAALLMSVLKFYDRFAESNATNPRLQREAAKAHRRVADIYRRLGQLDKAESASRRAAAMYEELIAEFPSVAEYRFELADLYAATDPRPVEGPTPAEAERRLRRALELSAALAADRWRGLLQARIQGRLGTILQQSGRLVEAESAYRQALALHKRLIEDFPGFPVHGFDPAPVRHSLADILRRSDRLAEARVLLEESIADLQASSRPGPWGRGGHVPFATHREKLLAAHYESLADVLNRLGETTLAQEAARKAREINQRQPPLPYPAGGPRR